MTDDIQEQIAALVRAHEEQLLSDFRLDVDYWRADQINENDTEYTRSALRDLEQGEG